MDDVLKTCTKCKVEKDILCFSKQKRSKDGHRSHCKECIKVASKKYHEENREEICRKVKEWTESNKDRVRSYKKKYNEEKKDFIREGQKRHYQENKEKIAERAKRYYENNKDKIKATVTEYHLERIKTDPKYKVDTRISTAIYQHLKRFGLTKRQVGWQNAVGYTIADLIAHLEARFTPEMTWENYGTYWHIDHIRPKAWFKYTSIDDPEFKKCWALENLQPLEAVKNMRKGKRYEGGDPPADLLDIPEGIEDNKQKGDDTCPTC